jgi:pimeloyl-ACP methyl ester carboxylesterase
MWKAFAIALSAVLGAAAIAYASLALGFWNTSAAENLRKYTTPQSRFMEMDGVRIHYQDEGSGPAIMLIHGSSESLRAWDGVAAHLHDHYRIVRFDVPDNGLSSADPKQRYTVEDDGTRITTLMDRLKIARFAIGGSSWGGTVAYNYAIDHPDRVTALVLISIPGIRPVNAYFSPYRGLSSFDRWINKYTMPPAQTEASIRSVVANTAFLTPATIRMYQDLLNQRDRPGEWGAKLAQIIPAEADARAHADLARVTVPTLILWGLDNPAFGPGCADDLEKILARSPLVKKSIYDNVGHKVEREAPDRVAADMDAFLTEVAKP